MKNRRLGRGLEFLLSPIEKAEGTSPKSGAESEGAPKFVELKSISSNPWQPRSEFDEKGLKELAASIKRHGVLQPIVVRPRAGGEGFELIAGERRMLASKRAGLKVIPAVVREVGDEDMLTLALVENVQRQDLGPVERAHAFRRLADEHGLSHKQIAEVSGMGRSTVTNCLRILELAPDMLAAVEDRRLTEGHARALLAEKDTGLREKLFRDLLKRDLSVRETEERSGGKGKQKRKGGQSSEARVLEKQLNEALGLKAEIRERGQKGKIILHYSDLDEFDRLFRVLTGKAPDV